MSRRHFKHWFVFSFFFSDCFWPYFGRFSLVHCFVANSNFRIRPKKQEKLIKYFASARLLQLIHNNWRRRRTKKPFSNKQWPTQVLNFPHFRFVTDFVCWKCDEGNGDTMSSSFIVKSTPLASHFKWTLSSVAKQIKISKPKTKRKLGFFCCWIFCFCLLLSLWWSGAHWFENETYCISIEAFLSLEIPIESNNGQCEIYDTKNKMFKYIFEMPEKYVVRLSVYFVNSSITSNFINLFVCGLSLRVRVTHGKGTNQIPFRLPNAIEHGSFHVVKQFFRLLLRASFSEMFTDGNTC